VLLTLINVIKKIFNKMIFLKVLKKENRNLPDAEEFTTPRSTRFPKAWTSKMTF